MSIPGQPKGASMSALTRLREREYLRDGGTPEPTKPSKPGFDGFEGWVPAHFMELFGSVVYVPVKGAKPCFTG